MTASPDPNETAGQSVSKPETQAWRKRPVVVQVALYTGDNGSEIFQTFLGHLSAYEDHLMIDTLEGRMRANPGDYIIEGVQGEIYACKPDIFLETYEQVSDLQPSDSDTNIKGAKAQSSAQGKE